MPTPSPEIIQLLSVFGIAFSVPTFANALVLLYGAILAPGRRTVAAALRAMGLAESKHFTNYHRVLNRASWSPWLLSRVLLALIIQVCLVDGAPLLMVFDETLERRRGSRIKYKGWFRDAVLSTANHVTKALGIRWICLAILVPVPWNSRLWALPFMLMPVLSPKTSAKLGKHHHTIVERAVFMIARVRRWQPERQIVVVGDGSYAAVTLVRRCQQLNPPVTLVSRLRLDAVLHDPPPAPVPGKRGPKPKKGNRQPSLAHRLNDPNTPWQPLTLAWYGGGDKTIEFVTGTSLWYHRGKAPVPIRWVLVRCPEGGFKPTAYFCSDQTVPATQIIPYFIARWNIEVTFEEIRAHLGFETQRQWSDRSIERTAPCLFGLFSLVVLMAKVLHPENLPTRQASWYVKPEATFIDALSAVRNDLWRGPNYCTSAQVADMFLIPRATLLSLVEVACYST